MAEPSVPASNRRTLLACAGAACAAVLAGCARYSSANGIAGGQSAQGGSTSAAASPAGSNGSAVLAKTTDIPVGGGKIYGFYGKAENGKGGAADGTNVGYVIKGNNTGSQQWELTYSYSLSPRTLLYAGYVRLQNDSSAIYQFNINTYAIAPGGKPTGAVFGLVHFF